MGGTYLHIVPYGTVLAAHSGRSPGGGEPFRTMPFGLPAMEDDGLVKLGKLPTPSAVISTLFEERQKNKAMRIQKGLERIWSLQ